jgi:transcription antitermination factor NusG
MTQQWYALRIKPHKEQSVYQWLQARDVAVYFPRVRVNPVNPRAARIRPYFPGYMFVNVDLAQMGQNAFSWTPGTHGLVTFGDIPALVPDNLIHELKKRIKRIEASGGLQASGFGRGDRVRIVRGPFSGYEALFDLYLPEKDRVQVLLAFLSQHPQPVKMDIGAIEKVK